MNNLLSFIIPIYNREKLLEDCLKSVLNINSNEYEIILVDDNSEDKSEEICKNYAKTYSFIKYIRSDKNLGPGISRNIGLKMAKGEYAYFIDSDDTVESERFLALFDFLKKYKDIDIFCFNHNLFYENGKTKEVKTFFYDKQYDTDDFFDVAPYSLTLTLWSCIFNREFLTENAILCSNARFLEDATFCCKAFLTSKKVFTINDTYYNYRYVANNSLMKISQSETQKYGISMFVDNLLANELLINSESRRVAEKCAFYTMALRALLLEDTPRQHLEEISNEVLSFKEIFKKYNIDDVSYVAFKKLYDDIRRFSDNFSKKIFFAPAGKFSLKMTEKIKEMGISVSGFLDNNSVNSPYAQLARDSGFLVFPMENIKKIKKGDFVLIIFHTSMAVLQLAKQCEEEFYLTNNEDFICGIE